MARSRGLDSTSIVALIFLALVVTSWLSEQPSWLKALLLVSAVMTSLGFWWLFRMPTTCGVANRSNPRGCGNTVKGALSACWLADHKARKRRLLWARILRRAPSKPPTSHPSWAAARSEPPAWSTKTSNETASEWLSGPRYDLIMLISTVFGGLGGVAGVVTMLQSFFDKGGT